MALSQLVYVSRRTKSLTSAALARIVARSSKRNAELGISGVLMCCGDHIIQLLEGEMDNITNLYERIAVDPLHSHVQVLLRKNVVKRMFPEWGMGIADLDRRFTLDRQRLAALVENIRVNSDTSKFTVEARVLLGDFKQQLLAA